MAAPVVTTGDLISAADWNAAGLGVVARASVTSNSLGTPPFTHTGLSVSHAAVADRLYRVTWSLQASLYSGGATGRQRISHAILLGGGAQGGVRGEGQDSGTSGPGAVAVAVVTVATDQTFNWTFQSLDIDSAGMTSVGFGASAAAPSNVVVEDIGPA